MTDISLFAAVYGANQIQLLMTYERETDEGVDAGAARGPVWGTDSEPVLKHSLVKNTPYAA